MSYANKIVGKNYEERNLFQLNEWVKGNSLHNDIDEECCPDFSCCNEILKADVVLRQTFKQIYLTGSQDMKIQMLGTFLGAAIAAALPDNKVKIFTDQDHKIKNN